MTRQRYSNPKPGTFLAKIVAMMVRPEGCTRRELGITSNILSGRLSYLRDMCGYDVRSFKGPPARCGTKTKAYVVHRIVGRYTWDGGYKDFIRPRELESITAERVYLGAGQ